ncbi:MAG: acyl CoA:acetate/3-ketoacid CoA transferase [Candidatus Sericytochromatia bacterium]
MKRNKIVSAKEAVNLIIDSDTLVTGGFVGSGFAEELAIELEKRYLETQSPKNLTLVYAAGQGDGGEKGLNHLAHKGLIKRVVGAHWGLVPKLSKLAVENEIEAYNFPQGVVSHLFRDIASKKVGTITKVGLHTFVDPRLQGGKLNEKAKEDLVKIIQIENDDYLFFKTFPLNVAFLRGTTSDKEGNITFEKEALTIESLAIAQAVKNSGGIVIVQVERVTEKHKLSPQLVKIPSIFVDAVVIAKPENHMQTFAENYNPAYTGEIEVSSNSIKTLDLNERKIISRRAAMFLKMNSVVNLGIGMPEGVASVANEEGILDYITLTVEPGGIGGIPAGGKSFGAVSNAQAIIDQPSQFDFYDGGGLDQAFLGMAEVDKEGNVNVSYFNNRIAGAGGFINISQNAKEVFFLGTFSAKSKIIIENSKLNILSDGSAKKFVEKVSHITFSGKFAMERKQKVYYITERAVFRLIPEGLELIEIADGIDIEKDLLAQMDFRPIISKNLKTMEKSIFINEIMNLKTRELISMDERLVYHEKDNILFVNFEGIRLNTIEEINILNNHLAKKFNELNKKINVIVNYDNFYLNLELEDYFFNNVVKYNSDNFFLSSSRYSTNAFYHRQLGKSFLEHKVGFYKSFSEAKEAMENEKN